MIKDYIEAIKESSTLEELNDVLRKWSDEGDNYDESRWPEIWQAAQEKEFEIKGIDINADAF